MKKISIIGAGVMGRILLKAVLKWRPRARVVITDLDRKKLADLKKSRPGKRFSVSTDNVSAVRNAGLVILAVKPQSFKKVSFTLRKSIGDKTAILSIMAGVSMNKISKSLGSRKIARAMPNIGARVGKSMTVWTADKSIGSDKLKQIDSLLDQMGDSMRVQAEVLVDKATAVSGSGPGFLFQIILDWMKAVRKIGFSKAESERLVLKTLDASNQILQNSDNPGGLVFQVASKGGTTEAGLAVLKKRKNYSMWSEILSAALRRARKLSN